MTGTAVVLLCVAAVAGGIAWWYVEARRTRATTRTWLVAASIPVVLVAAAAVFGLAGDPAGEALLTVARAAAVVAAVTGGSLVATALLQVADPAKNVTEDDPTGDASAYVSDPQTLRGGTSIGALERLGVAITLLAGWPEGVAVVLGIKGVGRYPALRRPVAAERFIIGSLASVLWAVAVVGVVYTMRP